MQDQIAKLEGKLEMNDEIIAEGVIDLEVESVELALEEADLVVDAFKALLIWELLVDVLDGIEVFVIEDRGWVRVLRALGLGHLSGLKFRKIYFYRFSKIVQISNQKTMCSFYHFLVPSSPSINLNL